jgi:uncharacterized protein
MSFIRNSALAVLIGGSLLLAYVPTRAASDNPTPDEISAGIAAFKAAGLGDVFDKVLPLVSEQIQNRLLGQRPDLRAEIPVTVQEVALKLIQRRKELDTSAGRIWAKAFTADELKAINGFFRSPAGVKYLTAGPKAFNDSSAEMKKWSERLADEMYDKTLAAFKAKGIDF